MKFLETCFSTSLSSEALRSKALWNGGMPGERAWLGGLSDLLDKVSHF